ncbi:SCO family protein [Aurantiacibacter suaedae]|uniref:SCO family protein n=1 Tax=Aurantiacibacter suaedae TaxID=2545755 RepID=UPI0010F64DAF|nr:SCO family protein [Aurantiacibacter suaedae]
MPTILPARLASRRLGPLLLALAALSPLAACGSGQPPLEQGALWGSSIGGDFTLVDETGKAVHASDYDGKWKVVYFGYAYCPDVCPFDMQRLGQGLKLYAAEHPDLAKQVQPLFITIDPARDTPEVLAEFTANFSPDLIGLTGTPEQVKAAADAYSVYYSKGEVNENGGYMMDHSNAAYLMDPEGNPVALMPLDVKDQGQAVAAELAKWVR